MKKILSLIVILVIMMSMTACGLGDSKITLDEFNQIQNGMSYSQVVEIIGSEGELVSESGDAQIYSWEGKGSVGANANVTFYNGKVEGKAQFGLK